MTGRRGPGRDPASRLRALPGRSSRGGLTAIRQGSALAPHATDASEPDAPEMGDLVAGGRSRHPSAQGRPTGTSPSTGAEVGRDPHGKLALFSSADSGSPFGTFLIECSTCRRETPVGLASLVRATLPLSIHLPFVRHYHSLMRCPACGRRTWVRVSWRA